MPAGLNITERDPQLNLNYLTQTRRAALKLVLSNSFGFGGVNCALLLGRAA
jgi:3-oxoacyl-[acyl-carrier-protein] synthase I